MVLTHNSTIKKDAIVIDIPSQEVNEDCSLWKVYWKYFSQRPSQNRNSEVPRNTRRLRAVEVWVLRAWWHMVKSGHSWNCTKRSQIAFAVTSITLNFATLCTRLLELPVQSLGSAVGRLQGGSESLSRPLRTAARFFVLNSPILTNHKWQISGTALNWNHPPPKHIFDECLHQHQKFIRTKWFRYKYWLNAIRL